MNIQHTFVVLAYQKSPYLEACIQSVLHQQADSQVVIATSTPNAYIDQMAKKYQLPVYVNPRPGQGIAADFEFALECTESELTTIAHQDDIYEPGYSQQMMNYYRAFPDTTILFSDYYEIRNGKKVKINLNLLVKHLLSVPMRFHRISDWRWIKRSGLRFGNLICCPSVTYVKQNIHHYPVFGGTMKSNVDWLAWERLSRQEGNFIYIPICLMGHRIHEQATTTEIINSRKRTNEDYEVFLKFWPKSIARMISQVYRLSEKSNQIE